MARKKNVLFIIADQWRGDCLGFLGHPAVATHNLDALAGRGVTFTRHFGQSAPCGPAPGTRLLGIAARAIRLPAPRRPHGWVLWALWKRHTPPAP